MLGALRFVASCDLVSIVLAEIEWQTHRHSWIGSALFEMEHRLPLKLIVLTGFRGAPRLTHLNWSSFRLFASSSESTRRSAEPCAVPMNGPKPHLEAQKIW
jgi:hypothetical protein